MGLRVDIEDRIVPSFLLDRLQGIAAWRVAGLVMGIGLAAVLTLYGSTAAMLVKTWAVSDSYDQCFLIPPISLYLIWRHRHRLLAVTPQPAYGGVALIALSGAAWLVGRAASVDLVEELALVTMIFGLHLAVLGVKATRINFFPLAYLYMAVPMGAFLIPPLQQITADAAVFLLRLVGVPVFMEGTYITIPNGTYFVAEACAGLRFLIATVTLGVLFGYFYYRSPWRWIAFMALSVVVPVVANCLRAFGVILLGYFTSTDVAGGFDHIFTGWVFLSLVTIAYLAIGYSFSDRKHEKDQPPEPHATIATLAPQQVLLAALAALVVAVAPQAYAVHIRDVASRVDLHPLLPLPTVAEPWAPMDYDQNLWTPRFAGVDASIAKSYRNADGEEADLYIGYYARQREDSELLAYGNQVVDLDKWRLVNDDSVSVPLWGRDTIVDEMQIDLNGSRRLVRYWYWVDGEFTANPYWVKLLFARSKLLGGIQGAAVIAVSVPFEDGPAAARSRLDHFLANVMPLGDVLMSVNGGKKS